jgi:hypothetical protein
LGHVAVQAEAGQGVAGLLVCGFSSQPSPYSSRNSLRQLPDVVAVIAVLREGHGVLAAEELDVAGLMDWANFSI